MNTRAKGVLPSEDRSADVELNRLSIIAWFVAIFATILLVASIALVSSARADERHWFNIYASDRGDGEAAMRFKAKIGPLDSLGVCYAMGAISIEQLNRVYPLKDFMGGCENGEILPLAEVTRRALRILPPDSFPTLRR